MMNIDTALQINTFFTWQSVKPEQLIGTTAIVIDVLRATTSINAALANGAKTVIPCLDPEEAQKHKELQQSVILCGEINGYCIKGFDIGNSPLEYTKESIGNKTLALSTSNGTKALQAAVSADHILAGCINNAAATADSALAKGKDINIIASGTLGEISYDDILAAGIIINELLWLCPYYRLNDASLIAQTIAENTTDITEGLLLSEHGKLLKELSFLKDIEYAAKLNSCPTVAVYKDCSLTIE
ncbi:MAG: 2-phosphosulfolactate phosphatase [Clostridia bacterium]|jgi:2-phosphosulfolactate phosphatase|nr:2-phosphosulfolactate phosphatase [Clostridia bacterium]MDD4571690.1 2-phosphosulfolactate phosphatase [Clostridia bacterium]